MADKAKKWAGKIGIDSGPVPLRKWTKPPTAQEFRGAKGPGKYGDNRAERKGGK